MRYPFRTIVCLCLTASLIPTANAVASQDLSQQSTPTQAEAPILQSKATGLPLRPDRTVEFTTTEGTWLSLDVWPDGRRSAEHTSELQPLMRSSYAVVRWKTKKT